MIVYFYLTLFVKLYTLSMYQTDAVDPDRVLTYYGTIFAIFTGSNNAFSQEDGIRNCISWGGTLATIISIEEDNRVFSLTDATHYQCWIGLEYTRAKKVNLIRDTEGYSWLDGSDSLYRKYPSTMSSFSEPLIKFRPNNEHTLEEGWIGANANENSNCFFCGKLDNPRGCGFTKDNYCYRSYQMDTAINWSTAQSRCEDWGGNLTSITSEEENLLIFQRTPINALNCWIGMYSNISGNLTWNDGRNFEYTKWRNAPSTSPPHCVQWNNLGADLWVTTNCETRILKCFICKKFRKLFIPTEPRLTITFNPSVNQTYTQIYPNIIQFSYQGLIQNFTLSSNIEGRWKLPDGTYRAGSSLTYPYLLQQCIGLYTFYLYNWDGVEVPATQINITTTDNIGIFRSTGSGIERWGILQNNSRVFLTEQLTTIICVGSRITSSVEWFREDTLLRGSEGSNILDEGSIQTPGYYNCLVDEVSNYSIYVANKSLLVEINDFTETVNYTLGSPTLLYNSNNLVPDSQIRWTTEKIETGDDRIFNLEYPNPVPLSTIFSNVGGGQHTFTCFYRNSPVTVLGSVDLNLKDTTVVTISYSGIERTFSDVNNIFFPNPQPIVIPSHTPEVVFTCNLTNCTWQINNTNNTQTVLSSLNIVVFRQENEGIYSLLRTTVSGKEYITASVNISTNPELFASNVGDTYIIYIGIAAPIILCFFLFIIITVIIIIVCISKKRRKLKQFASRQFTNEDSDSPSKDNDVQNSNGLYSTVKSKKKKNYEKFDEEIVETTFTQSIESTNYENITASKEGDDSTYEKVPENIRSLSIPLDTYKMHVNELWQNEGSLENDYETLGGKAHRYPCTNGTLDPNRVKNRFKLIYPYDKSRVILKETSEDPSSDYINASYIPGLYVKETFIAAQAPKDVTLQSFWQMIVENDVSNIVMVTNLVESGRIKCEAYFPVKEGKKLITGPYEIILDKEEILIGYTIRMLTVFHNGKNKQIKQFHFTAWPDHDVPDLHNELLLFTEKVQTQKIDSKSPILVHCSAGVGRSGTFLAIYNLLAAIKQGNAISIYNVVHEMREHRPQMVQTFSQYKFIYLSVLEMLLGSTSIPNDEFTATYKLYMQSESEGYVSVFFQQFSELNYQCDKGFEHICTTALNDSNKDKNPIKTILPSDKNRLILFSPHWEGDYINATGIDDNQYIITITPTRNTLGDFLQLLYQFKPSMVVFLATPKELRLIQDEKSDRVVYWPKQGEPLDTNAFTLTSLSSEKFSSMIRSKIRLTHTIGNDVSEFTHILSTKWNERGEPELGNVAMLLNAILKQKQDSPGSPIIFHCTDGAGKTGVLFTVFKAILESKEKNFIDIFHIVKKLRNERMNFVSTLNHFVSCFSLMNEYCSNAV